ncbi:MAG: ORF6N domain-containing protein [Pseudomonadota bacterium]
MSNGLLPLETITHRIVMLRGQKVLIDADLAALYGVETRRLNEQVRRNLERFPEDFIFEITDDEFANLKSHFATSSWGGRRKLPLAFTEHGAIMAASVLKSQRAVEVSVYVVRAFVQLRELVVSNKELALRLDDLENKIELMSLKHDTFEHNTRVQLKQIFDALRELMAQPKSAKKHAIGFVTPEDAPSKPKGAKAKR